MLRVTLLVGGSLWRHRPSRVGRFLQEIGKLWCKRYDRTSKNARCSVCESRAQGTHVICPGAILHAVTLRLASERYVMSYPCPAMCMSRSLCTIMGDSETEIRVRLDTPNRRGIALLAHARHAAVWCSENSHTR